MVYFSPWFLLLLTRALPMQNMQKPTIAGAKSFRLICHGWDALVFLVFLAPPIVSDAGGAKL